MLTYSLPDLGQMLGSFLWPLFRIMGFFLSVPVLGTRMVPARVRIVLSVAVALLVAPMLEPVAAPGGLSPAMVLLVLQQVLIGVALGFFLQLVFQIFVLAGQMIAMQMGLGFASMVDPGNGVNVAIISTIYMMFVSLLFVTFDGHLLMIGVLVDSFEVVPVGAPGLDGGQGAGLLPQLLGTISWVFSSAMVLALPALTALLISNFAFGIMTRAAPQLNIFALGFPVALLLGLFIMWVSLPAFSDAIGGLFPEVFSRMRALTL